MDTLLLHRPSPALTTTATPKLSHKRPCCSAASDLNKPNFTTASFNSDVLLESFLGLSDSSLDFSFDRIMNSKNSDAEQNDIINKALRLGSALVEAGRRSSRARASLHNAVVWALSPDLTVKVFSMLDTQSVCYAAAACSFFKNCAADPVCYSNIDLITVVPRVNNAVVATMVHRAGKGLQSLKLGCVPGPLASSSGSPQPLVNCIRNSTDAAGFSWNDKKSRQGKDSFVLTRTCLAPLNANGGTPGACLSRLHLYNIERLDNTALMAALTACPSLLDLEIVGLNVELSLTLESNLGGSTGGGLLEVLILRDCVQLKEVEVARLLSAVLAGDFRHLKYLDISNREGLVSEGDRYRRCCSSSFIPVERLLEERPDLYVLAEFPLEGSFNEVDSSDSSDVNSEINSTSNSSSLASEGSSFTSTSESSFSSDPGSGSEDSSFMSGESSDEVDNVSV